MRDSKGTLALKANFRIPISQQYSVEEVETKASTERLVAGFDDVSASLKELRRIINNVMEAEDE